MAYLVGTVCLVLFFWLVQLVWSELGYERGRREWMKRFYDTSLSDGARRTEDERCEGNADPEQWTWPTS